MSVRKKFICRFSCQIFLTYCCRKILTFLEASNLKIGLYWSGLFAKVLEQVNIKNVSYRVGSVVGSGLTRDKWSKQILQEQDLLLTEASRAAASVEGKKRKENLKNLMMRWVLNCSIKFSNYLVTKYQYGC
ncbi:hypothetical protein WA026_022803 [Henosepilachna vigintioctopunctata]|uniref:Uncharacterized protein n=1 Tax=Henosepilachna vigintioctopunctata TaxID=420089 RepID=A0AAW1VB88_9CUCU